MTKLNEWINEGRKEGKERELFLIVQCELINVEGIIGLENHHLATTVGIIVSAKCSGMGREWGQTMACYSIHFCVVWAYHSVHVASLV